MVNYAIGSNDRATDVSEDKTHRDLPRTARNVVL
jgi:hypothetical protein